MARRERRVAPDPALAEIDALERALREAFEHAMAFHRIDPAEVAVRRPEAIAHAAAVAEALREEYRVRLAGQERAR